MNQEIRWYILLKKHREYCDASVPLIRFYLSPCAGYTSTVYRQYSYVNWDVSSTRREELGNSLTVIIYTVHIYVKEDWTLWKLMDRQFKFKIPVLNESAPAPQPSRLLHRCLLTFLHVYSKYVGIVLKMIMTSVTSHVLAVIRKRAETTIFDGDV